VNSETTETKSIRFSGNNAHLPQSALAQARCSSEEWHDHDLESVFGMGMREGTKTFSMVRGSPRAYLDHVRDGQPAGGKE
jgi:hypothetical protein